MHPWLLLLECLQSLTEPQCGLPDSWQRVVSRVQL